MRPLGALMLATAGALVGVSSTAGAQSAASSMPAASSASSPAGAAEFPRRRPGLWEIRSVGSQAVGLPAIRFCVGEQTDNPASHLDRTPGTRGSCTMGAFERAGEAWLSETICRESRAVVVSRAIAAGDFSNAYRIDTLVTYDPPLGGVRKEDKDAVVAVRIGDCPATHRPGDMIFPGMGTLNMSDGHFRPEPEPRPPRSREASSRRGPPAGSAVQPATR